MTNTLGELGESLSHVHTTVVLAMSADGKISDSDRTAARFSSSQDLAHLETEIAKADAVLFGAGTLRAYGTCLPVRQPDLIRQRQTHQKPDQPIQIICSRSGEINPALRFFKQAVPRWLLTTQQGAKAWEHQDAFEHILYLPPSATNWAVILQTLLLMGIQNLAVLGGGTLVAELVQQNLIDEVHLTICPLLIGGQTAPTPYDGTGLPINLAPRLQLIQAKTIGNEVFLHYRRYRPHED
ncbi:MAG: RibD family protein [Cyanobacteria bacterium P01_F01_bin.86]